MVERLRPGHEPKLAALRQLAAGRLSERGRQRLLRHVARCEPCRTALEGLRRFEVLAHETAASEPPAIEWARIEAAALSAAQSELRRRRVRRWLPAIAAAALVVLGLQLWRAQPQTEPLARRPAVAPAPTTAPAAVAVEITALVGAVHARLPDGRTIELSLDSRPEPGWTIETGAGAEAHLSLADTAQVLVPGEASLLLDRLAPDAIALGVARGNVVSKVRPLGGRRYDVAAAGYLVSVRGTHFSVRSDAAPSSEGQRVDVHVTEGHVHVLDPTGTRVADLLAPSDWASAPPATPPAGGVPAGGVPAGGAAAGGVTGLRIARHASARGDAIFSIPWLAPVVAWHIGGDRLSAAGELRMRVPPGMLALGAELGDGRIVELQVEVSPLGTRFDPAWLRLPSAARPSERRPAGELDPAAASSVLRSAQPAMQRCYERSLRTTDLSGSVKLKLRLAIDGAGKVRTSTLEASNPVPESMSSCVRDATRTLLFPPPGGGGVTFEAPLSFRTR